MSLECQGKSVQVEGQLELQNEDQLETSLDLTKILHFMISFDLFLITLYFKYNIGHFIMTNFVSKILHLLTSLSVQTLSNELSLETFFSIIQLIIRISKLDIFIPKILHLITRWHKKWNIFTFLVLLHFIIDNYHSFSNFC